jgi:hypothetical protein
MGVDKPLLYERTGAGIETSLRELIFWRFARSAFPPGVARRKMGLAESVLVKQNSSIETIQ